MADENRQVLSDMIKNNSIAVAAILVVLMLIIPLPSFLLDLFLSLIHI